MLGYYTMAQTSFLLFMSVIVAMAVCMAWRIADEELQERQVSSCMCEYVWLRASVCERVSVSECVRESE